MAVTKRDGFIDVRTEFQFQFHKLGRIGRAVLQLSHILCPINNHQMAAFIYKTSIARPIPTIIGHYFCSFGVFTIIPGKNTVTLYQDFL